MALINCPKCGEEISDKATTCVHCGHILINSYKTQYCVECGSPITPEMKVCSKCGCPIEEESEAYQGPIVTTYVPPKRVNNCGNATGESENSDVHITQYVQEEPVVTAISNTKETKKKDSILSVIAAVFALFGWITYAIFAYIGLVVAIVDLALAPKENPKCRHLGSYFAVVIVIIVVIFTFAQFA